MLYNKGKKRGRYGQNKGKRKVKERKDSGRGKNEIMDNHGVQYQVYYCLNGKNV